MVNIPDKEYQELMSRLKELEAALAGHKRTEEELYKSREYFRLLAEKSAEIILVADKEGTLTYASPSVERLLGYKPDELVGKSAFTFIRPADLPRALVEYGKAILIKNAYIHNSFRVSHKDGSERILEGYGHNLLDNPIVEGFIMNLQDSTERIRAEEELSQKVKELEKTTKIMEGREDRIIELKQRVKELEARLK